uniref:Uncharacterized protein n=1 Tax=Lactuca sativa TaxID=4236 RepID=A0A9R1W0W4_LACSA|nr:hypothetical protein LSAT_V11C300144930 [Lactuca sativa]
MIVLCRTKEIAYTTCTYEYLRGKILDVLPEYSKKAEDHLSKAVCLGNSIWKKGDLPATRNCFTLSLSKGPYKRILSQLSMLERRMAQGKKHFLFFQCGADNQEEIVSESIKHAKEAIPLDVKDENNLGNACLTCFFVMGAWDHNKLHQSLKAYQKWYEKYESMKSNPYLYFNSATVNTYLENYERALSKFEAAASKDPCLNATEEVQKMVNLFDKLDTLLKASFYLCYHPFLFKIQENCILNIKINKSRNQDWFSWMRARVFDENS